MTGLFDLHCDTAFEIYKHKEKLYSNNHGVSIDKFSVFKNKAQLFAIWSDNEKTEDETYLDFLHITTEFLSHLEENAEFTALCKTREDLKNCLGEGKLASLLSVEDAKLLSGDISRLEKLYNTGVRVLTLGWKGHSCVGGSYDTDDGLSEFGFEVLRECERLGITVDVSHLSEKGFWDVAGKAAKPFIATHSNASILCAHKRNLTDIQFRTIAQSGGICGISLVGKHLSKTLPGEKSEDLNTVFDTVCSHIEHFLSIDEKAVCLGLDLDGTEPLAGLENVSKIPALYEALTNRGLDEKTADSVFFNNAYNFFETNLPEKNVQ